MQLIDWNVATATATRLVPPGPRLTLTEAIAVVDDLRDLAEQASGHVRDFTGLAADGSAAPVAVVDRPEWVRSNVDGFRQLIDPLLETVLAGRAPSFGPIASVVGPRATGAEVGGLLAYLATRVLGQFELLGPAPDGAGGGGRLTLVAPNIVAAEQALAVDRHDFRLWVCLHEVTHRTQFAAAPWLHEHVRALLRDYLTAADLDPHVVLSRLRGALGSVGDLLRGGSDQSLLDLVQTPEQRKVLDRVTGLMSLLEGHADFVMDGVGPAVVPTVDTIRARFEGRRRVGNPLERLVRRLFGLEMKLKQYAEGARFVREVVQAVGRDGLNRVWTGAELLPDAAEIRDPQRWLQRVAPDPPAELAAGG
ncbi:MAG TPA: zinc-dependent metalloprotease [Mycobacteriales bacterium]|nr:zinc-dependent metalloprotease [Mycobacteriales bacterium]